MIRLKLAALLLSLWAPGSAMAAEAGDAPEEIVVTGRLPGPPLWVITHQGNTVWLFADVNPMPANFDWDSSYVERLIAGADAFLSKPILDLKVGVPGPLTIWRVTKLQDQRMELSSGTTLDEVIGPESLLAFRNIMADWNIQHPSIMKYKPYFAGFILYGNILGQSNMESSDAVLRKLESLRRKHRIPRTETEISYNPRDFIEYLEETRTLPDNFGTQCLEDLLAAMRRISAVKEHRELWYRREVSFRDFADRESSCVKTYAEDSQWHIAKHQALKQLWYENLGEAIKSRRNTFAVVDMNLFALPSREFYQWIEANGYELKEPE